MDGQRIGYIRVSSFDQNPERQLEHVPVRPMRWPQAVFTRPTGRPFSPMAANGTRLERRPFWQNGLRYWPFKASGVRATGR